MLTSYVPYQPLSSIQTQSTIFEQVYGSHRQRPTSISLNVQWIPVVNHSSTNIWSTNNIKNRKLKTETFFDIGAIREQQQPKAVTPPSSDYTDAYLNAFAPKPIPTKRIYRINAPVFANFAPIRTNLSTNRSIKTSETRFNNINNIKTSNLFNKTVPSFPNSSSTYSSSFIPIVFPKYEPLSSTQPSSYQTQTYKPNDYTPFHNRQSFETTRRTSPQQSSSTLSATDRSESPSENVHRPLPPNSLKTYPSSSTTSSSSSPTKSTYKPSVSFQSAPLPFSNNIRQSSVNEQTVLSPSNIEKQINRPETLLFQPDEDIRSPSIEKPSPIITPLLESPITRVESKTEPERTSTEELSTTISKPIEILEKAIDKYDAIIDQISEVLAGISPLSSTVSSMSPGKSVLDYELTSDGSPVLQRKSTEAQPPQQPTTPVRNTITQRVKGKYLIRGDSYDKIITAIADLDNELTPPPEIQKSSTTVIEEENEEPITPSLEDQPIPSSSEQLKDEANSFSFDQHQTSLISPSDDLTSELRSLNETKLQPTTDTLSDHAVLVQQQTDISPNLPIVETVQKETSEPKHAVTSSKYNEKHVTWHKNVLINDDDESSSYQSLTEESSLPETPIATTKKERLTSDESTTVVEQKINLPISIENIVIDDPVNKPSSSNDQQVIRTKPAKLSTRVPKQRIESSSSSGTSSSFSDSVDQETPSSDPNEPRSSDDERITSPRNSDRQSPTISDVVTKENTNSQVDETVSSNSGTPIQPADVTESDVLISAIEDTPLSPSTIIESPINTSTNSTSTRYISSDVYHDDLGDHTQFVGSPSDIDTENKKISLLVSLRQTITTPATPLIEAIQSVVSGKRTLTATRSPKNKAEIIDQNENETSLATTMVAGSNEENNEHAVHFEEDKPSVDTLEEPKTMSGSLHDTITESIPTIVSNLQANKQEMMSTSSTEPVSGIFTAIEDVKNLTAVESTPLHDNTDPSVEKFDDHSTNEIKSTSSSLFDSIPGKVSDAMITLTDTKEDGIVAEVPSMETQTAEELIRASLSSDSLREESTDNSMDAFVALTYSVNVGTPINFPPEASNAAVSDQKIDSIISSPSTDENLPLVEQNFASTNVHTKAEKVISTETVRDQPSSPEEKEQVLTPEKSEFYLLDKIPNEEKISSTTVSSQVSDDEVFQSSTHPSLLDAVSPKNAVPTTDKTNTQVVSTKPLMMESTLTFETNEVASANNRENEFILQTIHQLINGIIQTVISQLQDHSIETNQEILPLDNDLNQPIIPQIDGITQQSATALQFDLTSVNTEIENIPSKPLANFRESSPTNTEPDSLELIQALQGHSIFLPNSSEQIFYPPEKSISTTTSSQVTNSDRYVSYAIHQMNDSSQVTSSDPYISYAIHRMGDSSQERLPPFPIVADIPTYKTIEEDILLKPIPLDNQSIIKEDDSTEFDATENLTSYSDDILLQRLQTSAINRQKQFDTSSTDDDVDDEIEQHDLTDLERIIDKLTQPDKSLSPNEEPYQRYDLATTPSSNDSSSSSSRPQQDDFYFIPGYSGLWRPSVDNENTNIQIDYDADDERKSATKTRTIIRTLNSTKRPLILQHPEHLTSSVPLRPDSIDLNIQPRNEYPFDISESDSYQTCPSSISKQEKSIKEEHEKSSDENIFLIRENERGVSLPITMKIDCDDIAFRLSTSSPIDTQLYSRIQPDLSSPSTHSEPPLPIQTDSDSQSSSLSLNDQQKCPSWLNTINTITTTTEQSDGLLASHIILDKSAKGPISICECHPQGNYIIIENTSRSKNVDLTNWKIQQENDNGEKLVYTFPDYCLLRPNHSLKILTKTSQSEQRNDDLIASSFSSWYTGPNILTTLINSEGKDCATLTKKTILSS